MEQLGLDGMPAKLFACTPSRLTTWLDCPKRYRMQYLDRPMPVRGPAWAHNTVGAAVHLALARWWDLPLAGRTAPAGRALLTQAWQTDGFRDSAQADRWKGHAQDMVERYLGEVDPADEPRGVERTVAFKTDRLALSGRVDRVDERAGEVVVVDYKTGRSALTEDDARGSLALALYALGCSRVFRLPCTTVELHHLPSGKVLTWQHTTESLARHVGRAEAIAAEASAAVEFPARPSALCGWCDFVQHCEEGKAAGGVRRPWDGLADDRVSPEG